LPTFKIADILQYGAKMPATIHVFRNKKTKKSPLLDWLADLEEREPKAYAKCLAVILELAEKGHQLRRPTSDYLRDGIRELRTKVGHVNYRILYFFVASMANVVCLSHGLIKEQTIPDRDIEAAIAAKKLVDSDFNGYTAEWEGLA
jgi:hypothetical protein